MHHITSLCIILISQCLQVHIVGQEVVDGKPTVYVSVKGELKVVQIIGAPWSGNIEVVFLNGHAVLCPDSMPSWNNVVCQQVGTYPHTQDTFLSSLHSHDLGICHRHSVSLLLVGRPLNTYQPSKSPKLLYRPSAVFTHTEDYGELVHCVYINKC